MNWRDIKKENFTFINLTDVKKWIYPESLENIHTVFKYLVKIIKHLDGYSSIYLPRSKFLDLKEYDMLINRYLKKHVNILAEKLNGILNLTDKFWEEILRFYGDLLNSVNGTHRNNALRNFLEKLELKHPEYISGALVLYYLQKHNRLRIRLVEFSKMLRLPRKAFSVIFNSLQFIIKENLGYEPINSPYNMENNVSIEDYDRRLKEDALYLIGIFSLPNLYPEKARSMFYTILDSINSENKMQAFKTFCTKAREQGLGSIFICTSLLLALFKIENVENTVILPHHKSWAKKVKISPSRLSSAYSMVCDYLIKIHDYDPIIKTIPSNRLPNEKLYKLIISYIEDFSMHFEKSVNLQSGVLELIECTLQHIKGDKKLKRFFKDLPSGTAQPHLFISVYIFIYFTYVKGRVILQKEFVKRLNKWIQPKLCYHLFNDLHYYLSTTFFAREREQYKHKLITSRNFYHKGQIYKFKVHLSSFQKQTMKLRRV